MIQEQIVTRAVHHDGDLEEAGRPLEGPTIPSESQPDLALIQRCQAGDMKAAEALFRRYHGPVHNLVARMVRNGPETEDLVQDVFLKAFKGMGGFKGASSFRTWLYQIATNTCLNHLARAERRFVHDSLEAPVGTDFDQTLGDRLPAPGPVPEEAAVTAEIHRRLGEAVDRLPAEFRAVLVLRDFQDLSYEEVAQALDLNLGTVKSRLARARRQVQKWVEDLFRDEPQFYE